MVLKSDRCSTRKDSLATRLPFTRIPKLPESTLVPGFAFLSVGLSDAAKEPVMQTVLRSSSTPRIARRFTRPPSNRAAFFLCLLRQQRFQSRMDLIGNGFHALTGSADH